MYVFRAIKLLRGLGCEWAMWGRGDEGLDMVCKERLLKEKKDEIMMVRTIGRRFYLVGKNEEDSKVLEHRTLRDHLHVQHPAHGCQKTFRDSTA